MEEQNQPVQTDLNAGEGQENQNSETTGAENQQQAEADQMDSRKVIEQFEADDKALAAAETKIVSLKRQLRDKVDGVTEGGEEDLRATVNELRDEIQRCQDRMNRFEELLPKYD